MRVLPARSPRQVSRSRIDLGIRDPEEPGRYLAGIECDGATDHGSESARNRDITRQAVLERLGWTIYRIWPSDWFSDRQKVLNDLDAWLRELQAADREEARTAVRSHTPVASGATQPPAIEIQQRDPALPPGTVPYEPHAPSRPRGSLPQWVTYTSSTPKGPSTKTSHSKRSEMTTATDASERIEYLSGIRGRDRCGGPIWRGHPATSVAVAAGDGRQHGGSAYPSW